MSKIKEKLNKIYTGEEITANFVFSLVIPVVIDQFFLVGFNFINTAMISSSGTAAVSAVNMVGSLNVFLVSMFAAIGLGGTVLIAQAYGRKDPNKIRENAKSAIQGAVTLACLITAVILIFHTGILRLLFGTADQEVLQNADLYMKGLVLSYPLQGIVEGTNGSLRGVGRTKSSLKLSLLMNAVYLLFNFVFVSFMNLGVLGLAYSINISRIVAAIFALFMIRWQKDALRLKLPQLLHYEASKVWHVMKVSVPFAAENAFFQGGKIILQMMIVSLGTNVIATYAISMSWVQLSEIIPAALQTSLVPIVGQSIGRGNIKDAKKFARVFVRTAALIFIVVDLSLLPFFPLGMKLFHPPVEIIPDIFKIVLVAVVMHPICWSYSFVLPSALRAAGDATYTTVVSLLSMWLFRVGLGYVVGIILGYGLLGIFIVMSLEWGLRALIFTHRFHGVKWYQKEIL